MTQTVAVTAASGSYEVVIGAGLLQHAAARIAPIAAGRRVVVVTDSTVDAVHGQGMRTALGVVDEDVVVIPAGEASKSFEGLRDVLFALLDRRLERSDLILAFGGGVVGDLAGFAAAIFKRGMDFIQIPTTLLAQVDSSVGGKTAIDTPHGKNLVGAFHQPRLVIADLDLLKTLPLREVRCGYAEILKCALIDGGGFFERLEALGPSIVTLEPEALAWAVAQAVGMKARIVGEDERETGRRALLNLGHTFGHALEAETGFGGDLLHGEAVAVGCCLAFRFALSLGLCPDAVPARVERATRAAGLPSRLQDVWAGAPPPADRLIEHMTQDKKAKGGGLAFILPTQIGNCALTRGVEPSKLRRFLQTEGAL